MSLMHGSDSELKSASGTSGDGANGIAVPATALQALRQGVLLHKIGRPLAPDVFRAIAMLCDEAHGCGAKAEDLLRTVKDLSYSLPEMRQLSGGPEREGFRQALITATIEEYYRR